MLTAKNAGHWAQLGVYQAKRTMTVQSPHSAVSVVSRNQAAPAHTTSSCPAAAQPPR